MANGKNGFSCQCIEIDIEKEENIDRVILYENRKIEHLIIRSNQKIETVNLFNTSGKLIISHPCSDWGMAVNLPVQDEVVYLMVIHFTGTLVTHKLLII